MRTLVIIPAYNEEEAILGTLSSLETLADQFDVLVVNDGSEDETAAKVKSYQKNKPNVHLLNLPFNCGIGAGMQAGFLYARRNDYDYAVQFDGDGQHPADQLTALVGHAEKHSLDLCVGSRFVEADGTGFKSTFLRRVGIRFFARLISLLVGERVSDPTSGFRCYGRRALAVFAETYPDDYPEPEALFWCCRNKLRVAEMPVTMQERQGGTSSIRYISTFYYMIKVTIAILIDRIRSKEVQHVER